ncbi:MAG: hypothetical protein JSV24_11615 [Bacteroidales bacterium]|nr:MAG: hypothetical protein JSV24_11615 [Bacteroidales bacterium]
MKRLGKYSFGIGDRFAREAEAQLKAIIKAKESGIDVTPVWNKSFREHDIIKSHPSETRQKANQAVENLNWNSSYFIDADHVNLTSVDFFMGHSDFFTIDVADYINKPVSSREIQSFIGRNRNLPGRIEIPGIREPYHVTDDDFEEILRKYMAAAREASGIYQHIVAAKGKGQFITEISMDEVDEPQKPIELYFILYLLKDIPLQTIAPKFTGQFFKGIDYAGDLLLFEKEFEEILLILNFAKRQFNLPGDLKLSIHSGSDKFSLYPVIKRLTTKYNQGIHLKTAGTTWLEEITGLALSGGKALTLVKKIYTIAYSRMDELCGPYRAVIDIDPEALPKPQVVDGWDERKYANTLRHVKNHPDYNPHFRQLLHVGYKVAAEMGDPFLDALENNNPVISGHVMDNLLKRHIIPLFS